METVVVSDTNIFIDLYDVGLLNEFFSMDIQVHTTDFIINELTVEDQKRSVLILLTDFISKNLLQMS